MNTNNTCLMYVKPTQGTITVSDLLAIPGVALAIKSKRWTKKIKAGVAAAYRNRRCIAMTGATSQEQIDFFWLDKKIEKLIDTDKQVVLQLHRDVRDITYEIFDFSLEKRSIQTMSWCSSLLAEFQLGIAEC